MKLKALLSIFALSALLIVACSGGDHGAAGEGDHKCCKKDSTHCEGKDQKKCCKGDSTKCASHENKCDADCQKPCCKKPEAAADSTVSEAEEAEHHEMHEEMEMEDGD